jgi:hypothetical protein
MASLITVEKLQKGQDVNGLSWVELCNAYKIDPQTSNNVWAGILWYGAFLWVYEDTEKKYTEKNKNELFKVFGFTPTALTRLGGKYLGHELYKLVQERGYSTVESCISYMNSSNPQWKAEARYIHDLRDAVYSQAFEFLSKLPVADGSINLESYAVDELLAGISAIEWPEDL